MDINELKQKIEKLRIEGKSLFVIGSEFATPRDYRRAGYNNAIEDVLKLLASMP